MRTRLTFLLAGLLALLALGACTNSGSGGRTSAGNRSAVIDEGSSAMSAPSAAAGGSSSAADDAPLPTARIRTAELTVSVRGAAHVAARADRAEDIAARAGGEVDSDDRTNGRQASAQLVLRVPPQRLRSVLHDLSALGTERSRQSSSTDVTERVADVTSRLASARDSIDRLRRLYDGATKVADVIAIESELSSREATLESLEAQQRSLSRQSTMARVSLFLETAAPHAAVARRSGFLGGLRRGWDGVVSAAAWAANAAGTLLPFLPVLLVAGFAVRLVVRRRRLRV
jgi:uncharacterized protein DUF4349